MNNYDVIIIGGGITGAGTARDCAMRGLRAVLLDAGDFAAGATGRNQGLLHSGARYAVGDPASARECARENEILCRIAPHCVERTGGLFITLPEDDEAGYGLGYRDRFVASCRDAGIEAEALDPAGALAVEPKVNPALIGAVKVPDGSVEPFRLCAANLLDAASRGVDIRFNTEFVDFVRSGDAVTGVKARDRFNGAVSVFYAPVVLNAAGIWCGAVARKAGIDINMCPSKGALLIFADRVNHMVINRCRPAGDGDILVPAGRVCIAGTTSTKVPEDQWTCPEVSREEVELLLSSSARLCPSLSSVGMLRAYAGVRPLVAVGDDATGRGVSRGMVCLDHAGRDGVDGLVTITGGKLMTYRLMAEKAADIACAKLGLDSRCRTADEPLPPFNLSDGGPSEIVCRCENVGSAEVRGAVKKLGIRTMSGLRRCTRIGMGLCQGSRCGSRTAGVLAGALGDSALAPALEKEGKRERSRGIGPLSPEAPKK